VLESEIEDYAKKLCDKYDILFRKVSWIGRRSAPDRLIGGVFVEFKAPGEKPKAHQLREHKRLRRFCRVEVIDSKEKVKELIDEILTQTPPEADHNSNKK
jgi:hypothetical protein